VCLCSLPVADDDARIERWIASLQDSNPDVREGARHRRQIEAGDWEGSARR
jgi:hypothetical protein